MSTIDTIRPYCPSIGVGDKNHKTPSTILGVINWMRLALAKRRSRIDLSELTEDQLRDIGITKAEAHQEASRSFWD